MATAAAGPLPESTQVLAMGRSGRTAFLLVLLTISMALAAWLAQPGLNAILVMTFMIGFVIVLGKALTGRALGAVINERKLMSLSRFQTTLWTVLIISGYFVIAIVRARSNVAEPLVIRIDWQLWTLLGISTAALVGSPLVDANKRRKELGRNIAQKQQLLQNTATALKAEGETADAVERNREGILYGNDSIEDARFTDMFEGDEVGNVHLVDVGKLQMFLFTSIIAIVFAVQLFRLIAFGDLLADNVSLPTLPDGLLALMGVSNATYLANKGVARTPSAS